jgi:poly-beta-1,6-N-acetyl-D-glucosamine synthase
MIYLIVGIICLRLSYWIFIFSRMAMYKSKSESVLIDEGVSVVICVKDNLAGLQAQMNKLLKQNYKDYELIIVDDFSKEDIASYVRSLTSNIPIRYINPEINISGKKMALTAGVNAAKYDWILQTDSDCNPSSLNWMKRMMMSKNTNTKIVLGFSPYFMKGGLVSKIAQYETIYIAMQYLSFAIMKRPYMGVGRNILFNKSEFLKTKPFEDNLDIASGDDDFLVQKISYQQNTEICIHHEGMTLSAAPQDWEKYQQQKSRHITTAPKYSMFHKISLGFFAMLHLGMYLSLVFGLIIGTPYLNILAAYLFGISLMFIIQLPIFYKLNRGSLIYLLPFADIVLSLLYLKLVPNLLFKNDNQKWS